MPSLLQSLFWPCDYLLDAWQGFGKSKQKNPFLSGNYAPVKNMVTGLNLSVLGKIPEDLIGEFVRNGPNPVYVPKGGYHWFDGSGMLHGVRLLPGGKVNYVNRLTRTNQLIEEEKAGRNLYLRIGELWGFTGLLKIIVQRVKYLVGALSTKSEGTANTAVVFHNGKLMALVENDHPYVMRMLADGELETVGRHSYNGALKHPFTAHPKVDPETGEMVFFGYSIEKSPYCWHSVVSKDGDLLRTVPVPLPRPIMMHDMATTKHYSLMLDFPLVFVKENMLKGKPVFTFDKTLPSRIVVLPRHASTVSEGKSFTFPAGFGFHSVNAWEEGDEVVMLCCHSSETFDLGSLGEGGAKKGTSWKEIAKPYISVFRMNMATGECSSRCVSNVAGEFPTINPTLLGRRNRYAYMCHFSSEEYALTPDFGTVVKFDLSPVFNGKMDDIIEAGRINFGRDRVIGECVFVPRAGATREDDGYLVTFVTDVAKETSEFWVLNALTMSAEPLARVPLPQRVPFGFHGIWVSENEILGQKV